MCFNKNKYPFLLILDYFVVILIVKKVNVNYYEEDFHTHSLSGLHGSFELQ